jgi:tetratricopeptide (TPR) repeat protein
MKENVILQNLRDFTVQIRDPKTKKIIGTGIIVSIEGKIVTSAHIIETALGVHPRDAKDMWVEVYFPQATSRDEKLRRAIVASALQQHDDDIVLLQVKDNAASLGLKKIAIIGSAEYSEGHTFRTYGFGTVGVYPALLGEGLIQGKVEPSENRKLLAAPIQLISTQIKPGMSGAAILDVERNLVVGIISEAWMPKLPKESNNIIFGVDTGILSFDPFNLVSFDNNYLPDLNRDLKVQLPFQIIEKEMEKGAIERNAVTDAPVDSLIEDKLGFDVYVHALRDFIISQDTTTPLTIGIDGRWGTGKTSLMLMLKNELDPQISLKSRIKHNVMLVKWLIFFVGSLPFWLLGKTLLLIGYKSNNSNSSWFRQIRTGISYDPSIHADIEIDKLPIFAQFWAKIANMHTPMNPAHHPTIWFDAWKFDREEQLWAALSLSVIDQLKKRFGYIDRMVFWLKLTFKRFSILRAVLIVLIRIAFPLLLGYLALSYSQYITYYGTIGLAQPLLPILPYGFAFGALISGMVSISRIIKNPFDISAKDFYNKPNYDEKVGFLSNFEEDFSRVVSIVTKSWMNKNKKLIIFIDDLDRCEPPKAADIIQAINQFLDSSGCIFVLGMDSTAVVASIESKYKEILEKIHRDNAGVGSPGRMFLDKIIQVPFYVPRPIDDGITKLADGFTQYGIDIHKASFLTTNKSYKPLDKDIIIEKDVKENSASKDQVANFKCDRASYAHKDVRKAILIGSSLLEKNPRQVKRFINQFRLLIYIANERKILEEHKVGELYRGLTLDRLAIWVAWQIRWPEAAKHLFEETQIADLRAYLAKMHSFLKEDKQRIQLDYPLDKLNVELAILRSSQEAHQFHWCHLPWEWWLIDEDFRRCIREMGCLWQQPLDGQADWLKSILTMTKVSFEVASPLQPILPLQSPVLPIIDIEKAKSVISDKLEPSWNNAPYLVKEWVGRTDLLDEITFDWLNPEKRVSGLIGFAGEGKSVLARQWLENLINNKSLVQPNSIFWWGFIDRPNVDEFLESILYYISGGKDDLLRQYPSTYSKMHLIADILYSGSYIFVLDGLEVMQWQDGDLVGLISNKYLSELIKLFAAPGHNSFCLLTSRIQILDLIAYTTYIPHEVGHLNTEDGRNLLRKQGVTGEDSELDKVVNDWDGHALTLSLLGSYLSEYCTGDIRLIRTIPSPIADERHYDRVHNILHSYDRLFGISERAFLKLFSAFRLPVSSEAFDLVFRSKLNKPNNIKDPITNLDENSFKAIVKRLVDYQIIRYDPVEDMYSIHPLIRAHYYELLITSNKNQIEDLYSQIKNYYLTIAKKAQDPSINDLRPIIEAVHYACLSEVYEEAFKLHYDRVMIGTEFRLTYILWAWDTEFEILLDFFPENEISKDPKVSDSRDKWWIINSMGLCQLNIGSLEKAKSFYDRAITIALDSKDYKSAAISSRQNAELHRLLGDLQKSAEFASKALDYSLSADNKEQQRNSLASKGWAEYLCGDLNLAEISLKKATKLEHEINPQMKYLFHPNSQLYADFLRRKEEFDSAYIIAIENLRIADNRLSPNDISRCHRILGDLCMVRKEYVLAGEHYEKAFKIASNAGHYPALIEALSSRGKWLARYMNNPNAALSALEEALNVAITHGYRLYEADIHIGLAWTYLNMDNKLASKSEAEYAKQISKGIGYFWGQKDSEEILAKIGAITD